MFPERHSVSAHRRSESFDFLGLAALRAMLLFR